MTKKRCLILISGSGTNMLSIIDNSKDFLDIRGVYSDRDALGIKRAEEKGIKAKNLGKEIFKVLPEIIEKEEIQLILLAGFLSILDETFIKNSPPILNIHPSLLPKYGGKGMYGINVHENVLKNKEEFSGATVHLVNDKIDGGKIILRTVVSIKDEKTKEDIQKKILPFEHELYWRAIKTYLRGEA